MNLVSLRYANTSKYKILKLEVREQDCVRCSSVLEMQSNWGFTLHPPNSVRTMRDRHARCAHVRLRAGLLNYLLWPNPLCIHLSSYSRSTQKTRYWSKGKWVQWCTSAAPLGGRTNACHKCNVPRKTKYTNSPHIALRKAFQLKQSYYTAWTL